MTFDPLEHWNPREDDEAIQELALSNWYHSPEEHGRAKAVEVGSWAGGTTLILAEIGYEVFAVDHWCGNPDDRLGTIASQLGRDAVYRTFCRNMGEHLLRDVFPLRMSSKEAATTWPRDLPIDLVFIDAGHDYESVKQDIALWEPLVRPGGLVMGHDYHVREFPGVTRAVDESGPCELAGKHVWWRKKA